MSQVATAKVTKFVCFDREGHAVLCDSFGNNVAFACPACKHPILAIMREYQRGSSSHNPSVCPSCGFRCWLTVKESELRLVVIPVPDRDASGNG